LSYTAFWHFYGSLDGPGHTDKEVWPASGFMAYGHLESVLWLFDWPSDVMRKLVVLRECLSATYRRCRERPDSTEKPTLLMHVLERRSRDVKKNPVLFALLWVA